MTPGTVAAVARGWMNLDHWQRGLNRDPTEKPTTKYVLGVMVRECVDFKTGKGKRRSNEELADAAGMSLRTFEEHSARALASPWVHVHKPRRGGQELHLVDVANLTKTAGSGGNGHDPKPQVSAESGEVTTGANDQKPPESAAKTAGSGGVISSVSDYQEETEGERAEPRSADATRGTASIDEVTEFIHAVMHALPEGFGGGHPISRIHKGLREAVAEWRDAGRTTDDAAEVLATVPMSHRSPAGLIARHLRMDLAGEAPIPVTSTPRAPAAPTPSAGKDKPAPKPRASKPKPAPAPAVDQAEAVAAGMGWTPEQVRTAAANGGTYAAHNAYVYVEAVGDGWSARVGRDSSGPLVRLPGETGYYARPAQVPTADEFAAAIATFTATRGVSA